MAMPQRSISVIQAQAANWQAFQAVRPSLKAMQHFYQELLEIVGTYQLSADLTNIAPDQAQQQYQLMGDCRPLKGLQVSGDFQLFRHQESKPQNSYTVGGNITYLTSALLRYQPDRFPFYYYFSDLLLDAGTVLVSAAPQYAYSGEGIISSSPSSKAWTGPVSVSCGLADNTTILAMGTRTSTSSTLTAYADLFNPNIGTVTTKDVVRMDSLTAELSQRLSRHFLLSAGADWVFIRTESHYSANYLGNPPPTFDTKNDLSYYTLSATLNSLFLQEAVSVTDLRRSYYNGKYLSGREFKNQFQFSYSPRSIPEDKSVSIADDLSYGIIDHLQLDGAGSYTWARHDWPNSIDGWGYSIGLTLHNLNFVGGELSDYDYFWGKITQPGDYVAGIQWKEQQLVGSLMPKGRVMAVQLQTAVISHADVRLNLSNTLINSFGTQETTSISVLLRADATQRIRIQLLASHGTSDIESKYDYLLNLPITTGEIYSKTLAVEFHFSCVL